MMKKKILRVTMFCMMFILCNIFFGINVNAETSYSSDNVEYEEGYIFVGESHIMLSTYAFEKYVDSKGKVPGLNGVYSHITIEKTGDIDSMFNMSGNLFFVFEGTTDADREVQISKDYIYSDGEGKCGGAVKKIHTIIDKNPKIKHWNIISYQGAVEIKSGKETADYYIKSYKNWIDYEFPEADCYFMSHSTITKFYASCRKKAEKFDKMIKEAFPDNYLDYTAFYKERYPDQLMDPEGVKGDLIHWNILTYIDLIKDVITTIQNEEK